MEQTQNLLFIVYLLVQNGRSHEVRCRGCREIVIPDYKTPTHIRGMIEFDGRLIPVIDPGQFFHNKPVRITNAACILIIEHDHQCRSRRTGILIEDIEEIMNLAAGNYRTKVLRPSTFNMRFVLNLFEKVVMNELLSDTHMALDLCEREKQAELDFTTFRDIVSKSFIKR